MKLLLMLFLLGDPPFDSVKTEIAYHESANGKYKIHVNANRTIDCGKFQLNSVHFNGRGRVGLAFDKIFESYGIGELLHERVVAAIVNDELNEALARELYRLRGLKAWTSSRKFITNLKGR